MKIFEILVDSITNLANHHCPLRNFDRSSRQDQDGLPSSTLLI